MKLDIGKGTKSEEKLDILNENLDLFIKDENLKNQIRRAQQKNSGVTHLKPLIKKEGLITVVLKECFNVKGYRSRAGSLLLKNYVAQYDSFVAQIIKENFNLIGLVGTDEFCSGTWGENTRYEYVEEYEYSLGGSSTGGAAAILNDCADVAVTTDTGGSTILPGLFNNLIGFKPSYGMISRFGLIPLANELDTVSFLSKSLEKIKTVYKSLLKIDSRDATNKISSIENNNRKALAFNNVADFVKDQLEVSYKRDFLEEFKKDLAKEYETLVGRYFTSNLFKYDGIKFSTKYNLNNQNLSFNDFKKEIIEKNRNQFSEHNQTRMNKSITLEGADEESYKAVNLILFQCSQFFENYAYLVVDLSSIEKPSLKSAKEKPNQKGTDYLLYWVNLLKFPSIVYKNTLFVTQKYGDLELLDLIKDYES